MEGSMNRIEAFVTAADLGNFTRTAEKLSYTQSTISKMIKSLEKEWRVTLFSRNAGEGSIRLTAEGERMLPLARRLYSDYINMAIEASDIADMQKGTLRIGTFSSTAINVIPDILEKYHADYPNIDFELLLGDYEEIEEWLKNGRIDCGFLKAPVSDELDSFFVIEDEYMAVMPKEHPLAEKKKVSAAEMAEYPQIVLERGQTLREGYEVFEKNDLSPVILARTWDDYACLKMVEKGLGVAVEPGLMLRNEPFDVEIRPFTKPVHRKLHFAVPNMEAAPKTVRVLREYLKEYFR
jgi:DNA-binding transcriptional LysR family regulator